MTAYGATEGGFVPKPFDEILKDAIGRARAVFGPDADLSASGVLGKILQITADEDALLWGRLEDLYYSSFVSTATGADLDRLGEDLGIPRPLASARGVVRLTVDQPLPDRAYTLPRGTVLLTGSAPVLAFRTDDVVRLGADRPVVDVPAVADLPGPSGDAAAGAITTVDPLYAAKIAGVLPPTSIAVTNQAPFTGGDLTVDDTAYRALLLGTPRTMWTREAVKAAVLRVRGVLDVLLSDPLGGVDVTQSHFGLFAFDQRVFLGERRFGEPYFFDVVVAHDAALPWRTDGPVRGVLERVADEVERLRPVGVHPRIVAADHIEIGVRARVTIDAGQDPQVLRAALTQRLSADIGRHRLGEAVLFSQVMRAFTEQPGVLDVQDLRLRRNPPAFGRLTLGAVPFQSEVVEAGVGENLALGPTEIAVFRVDGELLDMEVTAR
ncbi:baseplate J/gp47 family protein [Streptomyces sp. NPDC056468]|uniref:baseplate J/gp47 family protein n=1 Tax=Streptomyces sp. NPDC056468 TaxID=3345830 RepID=UPI0036A31432